jgi:tetratricopeptide (TPR) repeat protein
MPPWKPGTAEPQFANDRRLTRDEIEKIARWVSSGAQKGRRQQEVSTSAYGNLGPPDSLMTMPAPFDWPASGPDVIRSFIIPTQIGRDRYVRAVEFRPRTTAVHHANIKIDVSHVARRLDEEDDVPGFDGSSRTAVFPDGHFVGWTPGQRPYETMPWLLPAGADLVVELHLTATGKNERVQVAVGLYFTDAKPDQQPYMIRLSNQRLDIPAGAESYIATDEYVLPVGVRLLAVQPHAHQLAKSVYVVAEFLDGRVEKLIDIPQWDFRWQDVYVYSQPPWLPAGTRLRMQYVYDNSAANPHNPSTPPRRVVFGQKASSEMGDVWLQVLTIKSDDRRLLDLSNEPKMLADDIAGDETTLSQSPNDALLHADLAGCYLAANDIAQALLHFQKAALLAPSSFSIHYEFGMVLLREANLPAAQRELERAVSLRASSEAFNNLGTVYFLQSGLDAAVQAYRTAVTLDDRNFEAHLNLARGLLERGRYDDARGEYLRAVELRPGSADAHAGLASVLAKSAAWQTAIVEYGEALRQDPESVVALTNLAQILASVDETLRQPDVAVQLITHAQAVTRGLDPAVWAVTAEVNLSLGRFNDARRAVEEGLRISSTATDTRVMDHLRALQKELEP